MQRAARKVAEENMRLRSMLASRGVSQSEIDAYLQSFDAGSAQGHFQRVNHALPASHQTVSVATAPGLITSAGQLTAQSAAGSSLQSAAQPLAQASFQPSMQLNQAYSGPHVGLQRNNQPCSQVTQRAPCHVRQETTRARALEPGMPMGSQEAIHSRPATVEEPPCQRTGNNAVYDNSTATLSELENDTDCPNTASCFCAPASTPKEQSIDTGLLISCETAATIIAEMRGDGDRNRIRASLGCQGDQECNVKNTLVLELMDER